MMFACSQFCLDPVWWAIYIYIYGYMIYAYIYICHQVSFLRIHMLGMDFPTLPVFLGDFSRCGWHQVPPSTPRCQDSETFRCFQRIKRMVRIPFNIYLYVCIYNYIRVSLLNPIKRHCIHIKPPFSHHQSVPFRQIPPPWLAACCSKR